jgi:hypothetical protein
MYFNTLEGLRALDEEALKDPPHGLNGPSPVSGWQCPNCGSAHAPYVPTCPEPPRGGSLRERLKAARP